MYIILYVDTSKACEPSKMPICRQWISINNRSQKHVSDEIHFLNDVWVTANNIGDILLQFKAIVVCFNVLWNVIYFCDAKQRVSISIIAPVFSVSWSFRKYSLCWFIIISSLGCLFYFYYFISLETVILFFRLFLWKKVKTKDWTYLNQNICAWVDTQKTIYQKFKLTRLFKRINGINF